MRWSADCKSLGPNPRAPARPAWSGRPGSNGESSTMYPPPLYTRWADPPAKIPLTMNWSSAPFVPRSEEHTSELQSHHDLVCRLLLEKKKQARHRTQGPNCLQDR